MSDESQENHFEDEENAVGRKTTNGSDLVPILSEKITPEKSYLIGWEANYSDVGERTVSGIIYELKENSVVLKNGKKKYEMPYKGTRLAHIQMKKRFILDQDLRIRELERKGQDVSETQWIYPEDVENGVLGYYPVSGLPKKEDQHSRSNQKEHSTKSKKKTQKNQKKQETTSSSKKQKGKSMTEDSKEQQTAQKDQATREENPAQPQTKQKKGGTQGGNKKASKRRTQGSQETSKKKKLSPKNPTFTVFD